MEFVAVVKMFNEKTVRSPCCTRTKGTDTGAGSKSFHICCCNICCAGIICGGAMTWPVPMPVAGIRIEAAVRLFIGLAVNALVSPFAM